MNRAARVFLGACLAFVLVVALADLWLYLTIGGSATISTGIDGAPASVVFLIGYAAGGLTWGLYVHWFT